MNRFVRSNALFLSIAIGGCILFTFAVSRNPEPAGKKPDPLFDGKTLTGWEGDTGTFRVEDGAIVGGTLQSKIPHNEFLCTKRTFTDFVLRVKFKVLGKGANAGVQFRSRRIPNHYEVTGYQADLGDGWWGALYDESRRNKAMAKPDSARLHAVLKPEQWNDYVIRAEGKHVRLAINGYETVNYTEREDSISQS